jgi:hypothetical protein
MANPITPPPPPTQDYVTKNLKPAPYFWKWLNRLQVELAKFIPALGSANQILGMNAAGTATEFKTLTDGNGIDITHAPGVITVTVNQMELANILAYAARHG